MQKSDKRPAEVTLDQTVEGDISHDATQAVIDQKMKKKREILEKRNARKTKASLRTQRHDWDFSGLEPPAPRPEQENTEVQREQTAINVAEVVDDEVFTVQVMTDEVDRDNQIEDQDQDQSETDEADKDNQREDPITDQKNTDEANSQRKDPNSDQTKTGEDPRGHKTPMDFSTLYEFDSEDLEEEVSPYVVRQRKSERDPITTADFRDITLALNNVDSDEQREQAEPPKETSEDGNVVQESRQTVSDSLAESRNESGVTRRSTRSSMRVSDVAAHQEKNSADNSATANVKKFPSIVNTPSPSSRKAMEEVSQRNDEEENIEDFGGEQRESVPVSAVEKSRMKAGLNTTRKSLVLDQTGMFRPATESTRIGNIDLSMSLSVKSPAVEDRSEQRARPGRDTSTPFTRAVRQQALSKTALLTATRQHTDGRRENQTIDPRMPTPKILEVVREARKSGVKSLRLSQHQASLAEDIIEGGTQTSPLVQDDNVEAGCQVTPGLENQPLASAQPVNDSLTEEVNIDLPQDDEDGGYEDFQPNMTNSGRKNPSPIIERRNEVEEEDISEINEIDEEDDVSGDEENGRNVREKETNHQNEMLAEDIVEDDGVVNEGDVDDPDDCETGESDAEGPVKAPLSASRSGKELRQAPLTRYLESRRDTASPLISPLNSPQKEKPKQKPKPRATSSKKIDSKLIFPAKQVKFEYQRFSRYKLKADAERTLVKGSEDFLKEALRRMSDFAGERGAESIHLCDVRRMMVECGFVPDKDKDPKDRHFYQTIHQIARYEQVEELIPCNRGPGVLEVGNLVNFNFNDLR